MADWQRVKSIFEELVELTAHDRGFELDRLAAGDADLRREVERLLNAHDRAGGFLDSPTLDAGGGAAPFGDDLSPPRRIGAYAMVEVIGEGGFGTVYRARQDEPVRRTVALKVIKPGMDTREVIARFASERQALALMDHPHIARVLDAGATEAGRPYFVMELVEGAPITEYCAARGLDLRGRLRLMIAVCHAVQHAHLKGIIHRDLKPSNVLVAVHDGIASPKVIDFGVSKALHGEAACGMQTTRGDAPVGTPAYMSPEQADPSVAGIDTRADIYSLGAMLYELLTGAPPFDSRTLANKGYAEVQRIICHVEPPRPSARVLRDATERTATPGSAQHRREVSVLARQLRGDLDWIVIKCLEKDRARRYETANELALELERHLNHEPVLARPPTLRYRLTKFARRNRAAFAAIVGIALALTLGLAVSLAGFVAAVAARNAAEAQRMLAASNAELAQRAARKAEAVNAFLKDMLASADPRVGAQRDMTVRESLDRALQRLESGALREQPDVEAAVRLSIGRTYAGLAQFSAAEREISLAVERYRSLWGNDSAEYAEALQQRGTVRKLTARSSEAEADFRAALAILGTRRPADDPGLAACLNDLALALYDLKRDDEPERLLRDALAIARQPRNAGEPILGDVLNNLGTLRLAQLKWAEAEPWFREALEVNQRLLGGLHPNVATNLDNLAQTRAGQGDFVGGEAAYRQALAIRRKLYGSDHPDVATTLHNLATLQYRLGELAACETALRESFDIFRRIYGMAHTDTLTVTDSLVSVVGMSSLGDAEALLLQQFEAVRDAANIPLERRAAIAHRLVELYSAWRKPEQASAWSATESRLRSAASQPTTGTN